MTPEQIQLERQKYGIPTKGFSSTPSTKETQQNSRVSELHSLVAKNRIIAEAEKPKETGFLSNVGSALKSRGADIYNTMKQTAKGEINPLETGVRVVGDVIGGATDVAFEGLKSAVSTITPEPIKEGVKNLGLELLQTDAGKAGVSALSKGVQQYESWKEQNPRIAESLEGVLNIASILPISKGAGALGKTIEPATTLGKEALGEAATSMGKKLATGLEKESLDKTVELVRKSPQAMSKAEKKAGLISGGAKESFVGGLTLKPTPNDLKIAEQVAGVVDPKKSVGENIDSLRKEIAASSNNLKNAVIKNDAIFNNTQFHTALEEAKKNSDVLFAGDKNLENTYDSIVNLMEQELKKTGANKISNVLQARKNFDKIIEEKFPNIFDKMSGDNLRANAVRDVRKLSNDFVAEKLPDGDPMKAVLQRQSLMFDAIDNIAANNASRVGKGLIERISSSIRNNPLSSVIGVGAVGLSLPVALGIITNPIALGTLLTYGTYRVGKKIITSEGLRKGLSEFLLKAGKTLNPEGKKAIQELDDALQQINKTVQSKVGLSIEDVSGGKASVGKTVDPLIQEAKGKSLEEFMKAQGTPVYHGTASDFEMFDPKFKGYSTDAESAKGAFWFTDDPVTAKAYAIYAAEDAPINRLIKQAEDAEKIAQKTGKESDWVKYNKLVAESEKLDTYENALKRREKANVKEAYIKGEFLEVDAKGKTPQELSSDDNIDSWLNSKIKQAIKENKAGLKIVNIDDAVGLYNKPSTHYAVFNAKQIKTKSQLIDIWNKAHK